MIGDGGTLTIPADLSDYEYIRFETDGIINGSNNHAYSEIIKASAIGEKIVYFFENGPLYAYIRTNAAGTVATFNENFSGTSATCRVIGIKAQKAVVNPSDAVVIDDDTFASATATNVPSAESVKALMDNTVQAMVEQVNPTNQIRYIDIGDVRIQWGHLTVTGNTSIGVYAMGGVPAASSLSANVLVTQGIINWYTVNANIVDFNTITFNVFQNGSPTTATIKWMLIGPKP